MIAALRRPFNRDFPSSAYPALLDDLERRAGTPIPFRVAETPCFFPGPLIEEMVEAGCALTDQLLSSPEYLTASLGAIPAAYRLSSDSAHPHFMTADFGLVRTEDGAYAPKLVELQAFPSVFAFQDLLAQAYREHFQLDPGLETYLGGHTESSFWGLFRQVVVGEHDPAEVVLAEIRPQEQKTLPDFLLTSKRLGIPVVDVTQTVAIREGSSTRLFYRAEGRLVPIRRIYNRVIVDELMQKGIQLPFDYRDDLDVEWAGHPNWYFRISKFSIPYLRHPTVPESVFLSDWYEGAGSERLHGDREGVLLKPLFSFAGKGIVFAPTEAQLGAIAPEERGGYLMQERMEFAPVIETPFGPTQAEVRILYLWPDSRNERKGKMEPVLTLVRLGRGRMMGVDHNRDQQWVGASAAFFPGFPSVRREK